MNEPSVRRETILRYEIVRPYDQYRNGADRYSAAVVRADLRARSGHLRRLG